MTCLTWDKTITLRCGRRTVNRLNFYLSRKDKEREDTGQRRERKIRQMISKNEREDERENKKETSA